MGFSLKIKTKSGGQHIIRLVNVSSNVMKFKQLSNCSDCSDETKFEELKSKIHELTQIQPPIEIRSGFPPKVLTAGDDDTLKACGIKSGGKIKTFFLQLIES